MREHYCIICNVVQFRPPHFGLISACPIPDLYSDIPAFKSEISPPFVAIGCLDRGTSMMGGGGDSHGGK